MDDRLTWFLIGYMVCALLDLAVNFALAAGWMNFPDKISAYNFPDKISAHTNGNGVTSVTETFTVGGTE